jgi:spore coat protein U-like protein
MKTLFRLAVAASLAACATTALAAQTTGTFNVTATVPATCKLTTASNLGFGTIDPTGTGAATPYAALGSSTINFHCTKGTAYWIWLDPGQNGASAVGTTRAMKSGSDFLSYELYTAATYDAAHVWANTGTTGTNVASGNGGGTGGDSVTVFGVVPAGQYPTPSAGYTDQITVTINY